MSDLIDRKAAIDALGEEPSVWYDGEDEIAERAQWRRDKAAIEAVPSAEQEKVLVAEVKLSKEQIRDAVDEAVEKIREDMEVPEIIRCRDCKYYIPYEWMFDGLTRSSNKDDYAPDEIGCSVNDHNYPPCGFCSFAERRKG